MIVILKAQKAVLSLFQKKECIIASKTWEYLINFTEDQYHPITVDTKMKHSIYTIVKHNKSTYLLYNTLFNSMITMSEFEYQQYNDISFSDLSIVGPLIDNGFLLPLYSDEYQRYCYYQNILNNQLQDYMHYTIALTSRCNARCIYCYEEGVPQFDMSFDTAERIAELLCKSEKKTNITWFGGEPLLKTELIEFISEKLQNCNKPYDSGIITNGSLMNENMIVNLFPKWGISWVQISIDGMEDEYLYRKRYYSKRKDIFERLISNIELLVNQKISVSIRLNMDSANSEECIKVAEFLKERFGESDIIFVYPAFLENAEYSINDDDKRFFYSEQIYKLYPPESGLMTNIPKINNCYYKQQGAFVIDTDGSVLCCERDIGRKKTKISTVQELNTLDDIKKPISMFPTVKNQCKSCSYYPKCSGGCFAAYDSSCQYDACFMEKYKVDYLIKQLANS